MRSEMGANEGLRSEGLRGARRERLLDIAAGLVLEEGLDAVRPGRIAERVGCTRPLVYQYFRSREEILLRLAEDFYREFDPHWDAIVERIFEPGWIPGERGDLSEAGSEAQVGARSLAGLAVRVRAVRSASPGGGLEELKSTYERRWSRTLEVQGVEATRAALVLESLFAGALEVGMRVRDRTVESRGAWAELLWLFRSLLASAPRQHS